MIWGTELIGLFIAITYSLALYCIVRVLLSYRTTQGALSWIVGLLAFPLLALPLFFLFGRSRFAGYVRARRSGDEALSHLLGVFDQRSPATTPNPADTDPELRVLTQLARQPFTHGNRVQLLRDGVETFNALFEAMENARHYILLEFYIVRSDRVGRRIKAILERKLAEGVQVYFIYDEIGSVTLSRQYIRELTSAGARVCAFGDGNRRQWRFQINFRNHRKILICDGRVGFLGGINLGDEYLGQASNMEHWRDTHCEIEGPAVAGLQLTFVEDWYWAAGDVPFLDWDLTPCPDHDDNVLILPTGPADTFETCSLFFLNCINNARERIWISSPYFVPDMQIMNALQLAALRGVDVRIIIPQHADRLLIHLAAYSYLRQAGEADIGIYRYQPGFLHQKVVLVDDRYAAIGTANLDNRSLRLNFEIEALVTSPRLVDDVKAMLRADLAQCLPMSTADYRRRSLPFRLACRTIRLLAPLL